MSQWKMDCAAGDGFTKTVEAETKDMAVDMLMNDPDVQAHITNNHPDMQGKPMEEMRSMTESMTTEVFADGGMPTQA